MTRVFIGGSRAVKTLPLPVRKRLDNIITRGLAVLVGDASGADRAIQQYLFIKHHKDVAVFCMGGQARNNVGNWPTRHVDAGAARKGTRAFYTAKDRVMTEEADVGFMLWDGESEGTLANVLRLLQQSKKAVVYRSDLKAFFELGDLSDWSALSIPSELKAQVEAAERNAEPGMF